jgi:squalene synthase HpnC
MDPVESPPGPEQALIRAQRDCRRLAKSHYENFLVASVLLPRHLRQHFYNVYAFCRIADDYADESPTPTDALARLDNLQRQLDDTFAGRPPQSLLLALSDTIEQFGLSQQPFDDLLDAFRQDQSKTTYESFSQLLEYCRRSANPVGRIVLKLGESLNEENAALSDQICTGLQLANFWQDVSRDRKLGRVYLPQDEMRRFGVTESMLDQATTPGALRELLASECVRAEAFFDRGLPLAQRVPGWLSGDIKLFAYGGLATLAAIRNVNFDVLRSRPQVGKWTQIGLLCRARLGRL